MQIVIISMQGKVVSDNPELVNFAIGLVNSVLNLREGQVMFFGGNIQITEILQDKFKIHVKWKLIFKLIWQSEIITGRQ